jgi:hypothetical protein
MDEPVDEYVGRHRLKDEAVSDDQVRPAVARQDRTDTGQMEASSLAGRRAAEE